jgi:hypothetical protein
LRLDTSLGACALGHCARAASSRVAEFLRCHDHHARKLSELGSAGLMLAIAIATSLLLTVILVPYQDYAFHFAWAKRASPVAYGTFLVLGAAAGWGGYAAATAIGWKPADPHFLRGLIYGAFGQAVVRVHLERVPGGEAAEALTMLSAFGDWLAGVLDVQVVRAVRRRLAGLPPDELAQYVDHLFRLRVAGDTENLDESTRKEFAHAVDAAVDAVLSGDEAARLRARSSLRVLGEGWVMRYKFAPPEPL